MLRLPFLRISLMLGLIWAWWWLAGLSAIHAQTSLVIEQTSTGGGDGAPATISTNQPVQAGTNKLYVASISTKADTAVLGVTGLGLTWTRLQHQCGGRAQTGIEVWWAQGSPVVDEVVTATLEQSSGLRAAVMAVQVIAGVSEDPLGRVIRGNTLGVNGLCEGGTDANTYRTTFETTAPNSLVLGSISLRQRDHTPGAGWSETTEVHVGSSGGAAGIATVSRNVAQPSQIVLEGTISSEVDYSFIVVEVVTSGSEVSEPLPGDMDGDGDIDVTDYQLIVAAYGSTSDLAGDFNGNGVVDILDFGVVVKGLSTPATPTPVPSPTVTPQPPTPTPNPSLPTPTPQPSPTQQPFPTPKPTLVPTQGPTPTPINQSGWIWISPEEIAQLPTSGAGWQKVMDWAQKDAVGATFPNISNQSDQTEGVIMAKALVYVRTGNTTYRAQAIQGIMQAMETENGGTTLSLGRNLGAYVVAAQLVGLSGTQDAEFRNWLDGVRDEELSGRTLISTHEGRPNNWGTHAGGSRMVAALYLGDTADFNRAVTVFKGWLGDRASYANFKFGNLGWQADPNNPVGINPLGSMLWIDGSWRNVDGVLPDDQRRQGDSGDCPVVSWPPCDTGYPWGALQGVIQQAWILHRQGTPAFTWEDNAVKRAVVWKHFIANHPPDGDDSDIPWIINAMYGYTLPAGHNNQLSKHGLSFYEWMFGN